MTFFSSLLKILQEKISIYIDMLAVLFLQTALYLEFFAYCGIAYGTITELMTEKHHRLRFIYSLCCIFWPFIIVAFVDFETIGED